MFGTWGAWFLMSSLYGGLNWTEFVGFNFVPKIWDLNDRKKLVNNPFNNQTSSLTLSFQCLIFSLPIMKSVFLLQKQFSFFELIQLCIGFKDVSFDAGENLGWQMLKGFQFHLIWNNFSTCLQNRREVSNWICANEVECVVPWTWGLINCAQRKRKTWFHGLGNSLIAKMKQCFQTNFEQKVVALVLAEIIVWQQNKPLYVSQKPP